MRPQKPRLYLPQHVYCDRDSTKLKDQAREANAKSLQWINYFEWENNQPILYAFNHSKIYEHGNNGAWEWWSVFKIFNTVWPRNDILIILFFDWITDTNRCEQILKEDEQTNLHDRLMLICIEIQSLKITPINGNSESLLTFYVSRFRTSRYTNKEKELMSSYLSLSPINAPLHTPKDIFTPR